MPSVPGIGDLWLAGQGSLPPHPSGGTLRIIGCGGPCSCTEVARDPQRGNEPRWHEASGWNPSQHQVHQRELTDWSKCLE